MKTKPLLITSILITILAFGNWHKIKNNKSPESELMKAGSLLTEARYEKSDKYAFIIYDKAKNYYDSAMIEWKYQNEKFFLFRNYNKVVELTTLSINNSQTAITNSKDFTANLHLYLTNKLNETGNRITEFEKSFGNFPMSQKHRNEFIKCKLLSSESYSTYKSNNYQICNTLLDSIDLIMDRIIYHYQNKLSVYFNDYPQWHKLVEQTISSSKKNNSYAIVIDKFTRELFVYKNGLVKNTFPVELGLNWIGDKKHQGDKTTPEGLYKVLQRKQNGETKYFKAFLLNYPNEDDKKRFALNKKNGIIRNDAKIGNLIEIHGGGGKGIDWTDGCIALQNSDMETIFTLCPEGTRVVIVGSVKSLDQLSINLK
nr:L,D-transpeptidase [uncultured Carboxylicivirga sp.]